jgi:hypothetical protein
MLIQSPLIVLLAHFDITFGVLRRSAGWPTAQSALPTVAVLATETTQSKGIVDFLIECFPKKQVSSPGECKMISFQDMSLRARCTGAICHDLRMLKSRVELPQESSLWPLLLTCSRLSVRQWGSRASSSGSPFTDVRPAINMQHFAGHAWRVGQVK